jgi:putative SOS response-associated peptidase YedK
MCHHYISAKDPPPWINLVPGFSETRVRYDPQRLLWPLDEAPVVRLNADGEYELALCEWGLLPSWWRPSGKRVSRSGFQRKCVNAVSEEITEKPSYREAFKRRRCLLPASEFAEQVGRRQFFFHFPERCTFMIAGLWEQWRGGADETVDSCTMLTTAANATVSAVGQDRMPVVFTTADECARWLDDGTDDLNRLRELCRPLADGELESYPAPTNERAEPPRLFDVD